MNTERPRVQSGVASGGQFAPTVKASDVVAGLQAPLSDADAGGTPRCDVCNDGEPNEDGFCVICQEHVDGSHEGEPGYASYCFECEHDLIDRIDMYRDHMKYEGSSPSSTSKS